MHCHKRQMSNLRCACRVLVGGALVFLICCVCFAVVVVARSVTSRKRRHTCRRAKVPTLSLASHVTFQGTLCSRTVSSNSVSCASFGSASRGPSLLGIQECSPLRVQETPSLHFGWGPMPLSTTSGEKHNSLPATNVVQRSLCGLTTCNGYAKKHVLAEHLFLCKKQISTQEEKSGKC